MPLRYLYSPQNSNSNDVSLLIVLRFSINNAVGNITLTS